MKQLIITLFAGSLLFASCKETDTPVVPLKQTATDTALIDTTYMLPNVPTAQQHNVLVEEFTGQSCSNCPAAHTLLDGIVNQPQNLKHVNVLGLYINNFTQGNPTQYSLYDFRTVAGTDIYNNVYGNPGLMPVAGIDRVASPGIYQTSGTWNSSVSARIGITQAINLNVQSGYNATALTDTITVSVTYLQAMTTSQKLTIAVVEDSIADWQEDASSFDSAYQFNNVLRDIITSPDATGEPIIDTIAQKNPGRIFIKAYTYTLKPVTTVSGTNTAIPNPLHYRAIVYVMDGDGTVLQSAQTSFIGK